jgi:hypothetical protein
VNKAIEKKPKNNNQKPFQVAQFIEERNRGGAVSRSQKQRHFQVAQFFEPGAELERVPGMDMSRARLNYMVNS